MIEPVSLPRLEGIASFARKHNWHIMLHDRVHGAISAWRGDGVIATLRSKSPRLQAVLELRDSGMPVVDLTIECQQLRFPRVISDHHAIGRLAGEHFKERGFANVAWFSSCWSEVHRRRYEGFCETFGPDIVKMGARSLNRRLAEAQKPVGVLAHDESDAALVIDAAQSLGLNVPDDVSVLGIGDDPFLCENQPTPISSIRQDLVRGAYEGAALLQRLMDGAPMPPQPMLIPPTGLTVRASTDTIAHPDPLVRAALIYISHHLQISFGAPEIASAVGLSRSRLDRLFADRLGHSVGTEIHDRRIAHAKLLLSSPDVPVKEIAEKCGFCNIAYFSNVFRRATGLSPRAWRDRNGVSAAPQPPGDGARASGDAARIRLPR